MSLSEPRFGDAVEVPAGRGVIRFAGTTSFAPGKWIGIELQTAGGKNDGSIQGVQYFNCKPNHGVFVRPSQVKVLEAARVSPSTHASSSANVSHARRSSLSVSNTGAIVRTSSMRSTPSTGASTAMSSRSASPAKASSGLKASHTRSGSVTTVSPPAPPKQTTLLRKPSAGPPDTLITTRLKPGINISVPQKHSPEQPSPESHEPPRSSRSLVPPQQPLSPLPRSASPLLSSPLPPQTPEIDIDEVNSVSDLRSSRPPSPLQRQPIYEDIELRSKLRILEAKRAADSQHIRELESRLAEAEAFISIRPKLQAKLQSLQSDLLSSKRELGEAQVQAKVDENRLIEASENLEMAMLDREVAEERAEAAEAECEELRERISAFEVELAAMQGDGAGEEDPSEEGDPKKAGLKERKAIAVLEKQNEKLKDVLILLRDSSQEIETEQRRKIAELERELAGVDELHNQYEATLTRLQHADAQIDELKSQLDDAFGAEELLVQLTERNLMLTDKNEDLRLTIEELEQLKELADELEEHHTETERALQDEIGHKDVQINELNRRIAEAHEAVVDYEGTIGQFRELVVQQQNDLESMRAQSQSAHTESATQASHTASLISLNLKLQSSAVKSQARQIDSELRHMEAVEGRELLGIVQPYLPQLYVEQDSGATNCYLFFNRMSKKCDLINNIVAGLHGLPEALGGEVTDAIVGVCEMRTRIYHFSILCRRFTAVLKHADVETFLGMGRLYPELAPMERRIDIHIDLLRRDEFRERECVADIAKMLAQFEHIAETYFSGFSSDAGERALDLVQSLDCDLDMFAAATGLTVTALRKLLKDEDIAQGLDALDPDMVLFEPLQRLLDQCKGAKVLSRKLVKRIEDLIEASAALRDNLLPRLASLNNKISTAVDFGIQLAQQIGQYIGEVRSSQETFQLSTVVSYTREIAYSTVSRQDGDSVWNGIAETLMYLVQDIGKFLPIALEAENVVKVTGISPWITRIEDIRAQLAINVEADRKAQQLNEEIQNLVRGVKTRDQNLQESSVKIELMERRLDAAKKQGDIITELEDELAKTRKREKLLLQDADKASAEMQQLEQELAQLKIQSAGHGRRESSTNVPDIPAFALENNLETSYLLEEIEALRGTVRFLRSENLYIKGQDLLREVRELPTLRRRPAIPPTPPLDPSHSSDSEDSDFEFPPKWPPTHKSLSIESKLLYRDYIDFASNARVVDLSALRKATEPSENKATRGWMPQKSTPGYQVMERRQKGEVLRGRVQDLLERARSIGILDKR